MLEQTLRSHSSIEGDSRITVCRNYKQNKPTSKFYTRDKTIEKCWIAGNFLQNENNFFSRIHRLLRLKPQSVERCFPLISVEPDSSVSIDEVSGETLSHITRLCRDLICECNKCTTGCAAEKFSCDACNLKCLTKSQLQRKFCGRLHATDILCTL